MNARLSMFFPEQTEEIKLINSDVYAGLSSLDNGSIECAVTSPPYWGQRDYEFEGQIGNEKSYAEYIEKLESIYRKLRDKLTSKGVFFLNIGDKYDNSKLGMVPYKLAKFMKDNGWILADTIVWYKPNHMPGSYKNRFTSTYEPIFVFAKNKSNYYADYVRKNKNYSNVFKINLQPTPYNHVAVYPEKLIEELLKLGFPDNSAVLDPFAGSGTTGKAIQNLNQKEGINMKSILIEASEKYVQIIQKRCRLFPKNEIVKLPFKSYKTKKFKEEHAYKKLKNSVNRKQKSSRKIIKIFENNNDLLNFVDKMKFGDIRNRLSNKGVVYLGTRFNNIDSIHLISALNLYGWVIRNQIVVKEGKTWYPVYLIVKDYKKGKYNLNIDAVRIEHKDNGEESWKSVDFSGYKVIDSLSKKKNKGVIVRVLQKYKDGMPSEVIVSWSKGEYTRECIKHNGYIDEASFLFKCMSCNTTLLNYYDEEKKISCSNCKSVLWDEIDSLPNLKINGDIYPKKSKKDKAKVRTKNTKKKYSGKFKNAKQINFGASPGARSSTQEKYFSVRRYYYFPQEMIADLLNALLKHKKMSKKKLTEKFPRSYVHTVGHWLRKDSGGSLPAPEDLSKLDEILNLPNYFKDLINSRSLTLQTVKKSYNGKNPGDFLEVSNKKELLNFLNRTVA